MSSNLFEHTRIFRGLISHDTTKRPWETWELDAEFIRSLSYHSPDNLRRGCVIDNFLIYLEEGRELLELVPDGPIPFRGFVKALACLIRFGIRVKRVKTSVYEFSKKVVDWVGQVKSAFESNGEGCYFRWATWQNLRKMRDLVEEICLWAHARLEDGRWSQIRNAARMYKEIDDFKNRLDDAQNLFRDLTIINLSGGISAIIEAVYIILNYQDNILIELQTIRQQQADHWVYVKNELEDRKDADARQAHFAKTIDRHIADKYSYDTQGKSPCDEGTREDQLENIKRWLYSISSDSQNFLWLTGDPGSGKSAITASLAAHCKDKGVLWAQFFINRNIVETTDPGMFFPTIARQLADFSLEVERAIHERLKERPTLADRMTTEQAGQLFIDALAEASSLDTGKVVAVIIDGLDEIDRICLRDAATIFSDLFTALTRYRNVKVFVSSRTEDAIWKPFHEKIKNANVKHVHLDTASSYEDVAMFLRKEFDKIANYHDLNKDIWPSEEQMQKLASRASGLFIWAVTAARYIRERLDEDGLEVADSVLNELIGEALTDINNLYSTIMRFIERRRGKVTDWDYEKFRRIVGAVIFWRQPMCLDELMGLLNLYGGSLGTQADVVNFVRRHRTLLVNGTDVVNGRTIPRLHKSFVEYITNGELLAQLSIDGRFCVNPEHSEAELAISCFRRIFNAVGGEGTATSREGLEYASRFCFSHADAVARGMSMSVAVVLMDATARVEDFHSSVLTAKQQVSRVPWFPFDFEHTPPVMFSPLTAAYQFSGQNTSRLLATAEDYIRSLSYSPNGELLVTGLDNGLLILWDARTGTEIAKLDGHTRWVNSVTFSPFGNRIASGSADNSVCLWNAATGKLISRIHGHNRDVNSVAFSSDRKFLASASDDKLVKLWDGHSGKAIGSHFNHDDDVQSVIFTSDGNEIVCGSGDGQIYIWDRQTRKCLKLSSFISSVQSVAISPLGDCLVAIGNGGICFWNRCTDGFIFYERLSMKLSDVGVFPSFQAAFFPDGKSLLVWNRHLSENVPSTLFLYDVCTSNQIPINMEEFRGFALSPDSAAVAFTIEKKIFISPLPQRQPVTLTTLSPDGDLVTCAFSDGTVWMALPNELPVVRKQLEGRVGMVKCLTFCSDNTVLAAVDDEFLCLWDVSSQQLRGRAIINSLPQISKLTFLADRRTLVSSHQDLSIYAWDANKDSLRSRCMDKMTLSNIAYDSLLVPDIDQDFVQEFAGARWFQSGTVGLSSGVWAYDGKFLIRARLDGSVTLLPFEIPSELDVCEMH